MPSLVATTSASAHTTFMHMHSARTNNVGNIAFAKGSTHLPIAHAHRLHDGCTNWYLLECSPQLFVNKLKVVSQTTYTSTSVSDIIEHIQAWV